MLKKIMLFIALLTVSRALLAESAVTSSDHVYTSPDGTHIYYEVHGPDKIAKATKTLVLVHGFTVAGDSWKKLPVFNELLAAGFRVVIMDMRGNGKSDKPHDPEFYQHDSEAKDVMGIASELGIKKYAVVGYSRGSIISSRLLVLDKRIDRAVLGGMGLDFTNPDWPRRIMFYEALAGNPTKELQGFMKYVKDSGYDQHALALLQQFQPSTSKAELGAIKQPVLVIAGTNDTDNGYAAELAAALPKATYVSVPGDHGSATKTAEFSAAVVRFLKQ